MSAEDCILYRKIGNDWCVLGYGTTFNEAELDDEEFRKLSEVVPFDELFQRLSELDSKHVTEHGICYAGEFISDPPVEVPERHRVLCCLPDIDQAGIVWTNDSPPWLKAAIEREEPTRTIVSAMRDLDRDDAIARLCSWFTLDGLKQVADALKNYAEDKGTT